MLAGEIRTMSQRAGRGGLKHFLLRIGTLWLVLQAVLILLCGTETRADRATLTKEQVEAGFVYNFLKFAEWPQDRNNDLAIHLCVLAQPSMAALLRGLEGKKVHGQPLKVSICERIQDIPDCDAVFMAAEGEPNGRQALLRRLQSVPVLTISDQKGFTRQGGMIELFEEKKKMRFKINLGTARSARIKISSRLLQLARDVIE